jgi:Ca2+-dependent lipid-binding protein
LSAWPSQSHRTKTASGSLNPEFNEAFDFHLHPGDQRLRVKVWDHSNIKADELLGSIDIPLTDLKPGQSSQQW